jgi:predicted amidohydrolase YtcJ
MTFRNVRWWENGSLTDIELPNQGADVDGEGKWLLPKFVDAHCHILPTGLDLLKLDLSHCQTREEVLDAVRDQNKMQPEGWLLAVQYDQTKYSDGRHITLTELDQISDDRPILLRHYNGHCSVCNSKALELANVNQTTENPSGGEFGRDASGNLNGVLLEEAHDYVWSKTQKPTLEEMVSAILAAGEKMSELGIVMAADMMTGRFDLMLEFEAYQEAAKRGCKIDTRLYVQWREVFGPKGIGLEALRDAEKSFRNPNRTRIAGIKLFADGAIGSATAAIHGSYLGEQPNSGQLIYSPEKLTTMTKTAGDAGYQVAIHAIGDYATDLVMDAFEATGVAERHRLEHAMIMSDAQIDRLAKLGSYLTFQPEFLMRFGHAYRRQLGEERTSKLKRARSVLDRNIPLSFSSDRPIVPGNPLDGIRTAINRPEGFDQSENISISEAIRAYTLAGYEVCGDPVPKLESPEEFQIVEIEPKINRT